MLSVVLSEAGFSVLNWFKINRLPGKDSTSEPLTIFHHPLNPKPDIRGKP